MAAPWTNADGLTVRFGNYYSDPANFANRQRELKAFGSSKQLEIDFDLTLIPAGTVSYTTDLNNDGVRDSFNNGDSRIPANAVIRDVYIAMQTTAAGGTAIAVGTFQQNGTALSANSLLTTTAGAVANLVVGTQTRGDGALTGTGAGQAGVGTHNAYVGITTTGTFTAGKGRLIITYFDPLVEVVAP